ncbi:MAG: hypothetical protein ACI4JT_03370, partial [Oscillospiraceae bacterium]
DDMINLPRPEPARERMDELSRAAQFAPFAALTGYDEAVGETARLVDEKIELSEDEREYLDEQTKKIREIPEREIAVTYFIADKRKSGGAYLTARGFVKKIDEIERLLVLTSGERIPLDDIFDIDFSDEQQASAPDD